MMEQCMLPDDYEYKIINFEPKEGNNYTLSCKIKDMRTEEDVKKWLKDYEEKSKFTWRIARTIKAAGRCNVYRLDLRCEHKTDARFRKANKKFTKNTDCPATLKIVIKRYFDAPKLKKLDEEMKIFPCIIDLCSWHNHSPSRADVLTFHEPRNPFSLPYDECVDTALSNTETHTQSSQNTETHKQSSQNSQTLNTDVISEQEKENIKTKFKEWCHKVCHGLDHNPEIYYPAVKRMLTNDEKHASTEKGLIFALCNYAKYEGPCAQSVKYSKGKGKQIAVQPTAMGRRKLSLTRKWMVSAGNVKNPNHS